MTSTKEIALKNMYRTNVEILLNRQTDDQGRSIAMMDGYANGDKLEVVASYDACNYPSDTEILNEAYAMFNSGSPRFVGRDAYQERSLSVGDVVRVFETYYAVESVGFSAVEVDRNLQVSDYSHGASGMSDLFPSPDAEYAF
jgi:hypothetical protein